MKITTSKCEPADITFHAHICNIFKEKRCFMGLHLDFSTHQMCLYLGLIYIFIELFPVNRSSWGEATIDRAKPLLKFKGWTLQKHDTNHIPDYFFNIGVTINENNIMFFLWKMQLWSNLK